MYNNEGNGCIDVNDFLDDRNRKLWEEVSSNYNIIIEQSDEDNYMCNLAYDRSVIYVLLGDISSASFTHELLHIHLFLKGLSVSKNIKDIKQIDNKLDSLLSRNLADHIGNSLTHRAMLPIFLDMGYKRSDFLTDYHKIKMNKIVLKDISSNLRRNRLFKYNYNSNYLDLYIGKYFAMKCCPNPSNDYSYYMKKFKLIDEKLFNILEDFVVQFDDLIIKDKSFSDIEITYDFCTNINKWLNGKNII